MDKNTVYILQKDCLDAKAGDEFEFSESSDCYSKIGGDCQIDYLSALFVENNPEWFKPKEEVNESKSTEQFIWTDELVKEFTLGAIKLQNSLPNEVSLDRGIYHFKKEKCKKEEPQWEILAYNNPNVFTDVLGGNIVDAKGSGANYAILKNFPIHSVKRFPDNTVWSVDMVTNKGRITGFHIEKGIMVAEFENNTRHCDLMLLIKAPKEEQRVGEDMICPVTKKHCDDECCPVGAECNLSSDDIEDCEKPSPKEEQVPIKVEIMEFGYGKPQENKGNFYVANFNLPNNAKLPTEKYQSIKSAIEDVLNEDKIKHEKLLSKIESKVRLANMINTQANYLKETLDYINSLK